MNFKQAMPLAQQGNADAQNAVALAYFSGTQGTHKYHDAFIWFEKAAHQHHPAAMFNLGLMYQKGLGTLADAKLSRMWLQKSADAGNRDALYAIGIIYQAELDFTHAVYYVGLAAEKGYPDAMNRLGYFYSEGLGVSKDRAVGHAWCLKAANHGLPKSQYNIGLNYMKGDGVPQNDALAIEWFRKSAVQNFPPAQGSLGELLITKGQDKEGLIWLKKAAAAGDPGALAKLSDLYYNEDKILHIPENASDAFQWYLEQAKAGNRDAQYKVAKLYAFTGNSSEEQKWLKKSAAQNQPYAVVVTQRMPTAPANRYVEKYNQNRMEEWEEKRQNISNGYQFGVMRDMNR